MLVDELTIHAKAGRGGDGVVRWKQFKFQRYGGPAGGDGGRGGDVYARGVRDITTLARYRHNPMFRAQDGGAGGADSLHGARGEDCTIDVPLGSVLANERTGARFQIMREGECIKLLTGGAGGFGNEHFKSSRNTTPRDSTPGKAGEEADFRIELQLVVDAGFIGFPNAGKSTLLNELTNARAKVGAYPFTTLDPNLGDMDGHILADIPGLIAGAASGRGLGHTFLRHIKRTRVLLHCISLEEADVLDAYRAIRSELGVYDRELLKKPELIILTKSDTVDAQQSESARRLLREETGAGCFVVSIPDSASTEELRIGVRDVLDAGAHQAFQTSATLLE